MLKQFETPDSSNALSGGDMGHGTLELDRQHPLVGYLDVDSSTPWDNDYGESIDYDLLCAAWQDEQGSAVVVRKNRFIDEQEPADWLVLYYDASHTEIVRLPVNQIDTVRHPGQSLIHFVINRQESEDELSPHLTNFFVMEFYVDEDYASLRPAVIIDRKQRHTFSQPLSPASCSTPDDLELSQRTDHIGFEYLGELGGVVLSATAVDLRN